LPVFVKLMSPRGAYDVAVAKIGEADIHYAERDKERHIRVIDEVYDHRLERDIDKERKIISAQSDYDFERHSYD